MVIEFFKSSLSKLKQALGSAADRLSGKIRTLFQAKIDEQTIESLEQIFYEADLGVSLSMALTEKIKEAHKKAPFSGPDAILAFLRKELILELSSIPSMPASEISPKVILMVGVNGSGKTTSTAKLAHHLKSEGKSVLVAAADTFRAAAIDQLNLWSEKLSLPIVKGKPGSDPSAVAYDAISAAIARKIDIVLIDTAGRLQTKLPLMQELEKMKRACHKALPGSPQEIYLVLDASSGQNALDQARKFHAATPLSGLILTKIDGTAKGGMVISIQKELRVKVEYLGIGEGVDDLQKFDLEAFINTLFN